MTQHGKDSLIGPSLEAALGCTVVRAEDVTPEKPNPLCLRA
jgi:hypothetical protein